MLLPKLKGFWTSLFETHIRVTAGIPVPELSTKVETCLLQHLFLLSFSLLLSSLVIICNTVRRKHTTLHSTAPEVRSCSTSVSPVQPAVGVCSQQGQTHSTCVHHIWIHPATQIPDRQSTQRGTNSTNSLRRMEVHSTYIQIYIRNIIQYNKNL